MSKDKFVDVEWVVDDGFCNPGRQTTRISLSEFLNCDTEQQVGELCEQCVQDDFEQKINPCVPEGEIERVVKAWRKLKKKRDCDE